MSTAAIIATILAGIAALAVFAATSSAATPCPDGRACLYSNYMFTGNMISGGATWHDNKVFNTLNAKWSAKNRLANRRFQGGYYFGSNGGFFPQTCMDPGEVRGSFNDRLNGGTTGYVWWRVGFAGSRC